MDDAEGYGCGIHRLIGVSRHQPSNCELPATPGDSYREVGAIDIGNTAPCSVGGAMRRGTYCEVVLCKLLMHRVTIAQAREPCLHRDR